MILTQLRRSVTRLRRSDLPPRPLKGQLVPLRVGPETASRPEMGTAVLDLLDHGKFRSSIPITTVDTVVNHILKNLVFVVELSGELCMRGARLLKQGLSLLNYSLTIRELGLNTHH